METNYISSLSNQELEIISKQSGILICKYHIKSKVLERLYDEPEKRFGLQKIQKNIPYSTVESGHISDDTKSAYFKFFDEIFAGNPEGSADIKLRVSSGNYIWYKVKYSLIYDDNNSCEHALMTFFDNSKVIERELAVKNWHAGFASILVSSLLYAEINLSKNTIEEIKSKDEYKEACKNVKNLEKFIQLAISGKISDIEIEEYVNFFERQRLIKLFESNVYEDHLDFSVINERGVCSWLRANIGMTKYPYSNDIMIIVTFINIDKQRKTLDNLSHKASHDMLTGLFNRDGMRSEILATLNKTRSYNDVAALFIIDLDDFKQVNDKLGHQTGDIVLQKVASALKLTMSNFGIAGRLGGDEFVGYYLGEYKSGLFDEKAIALLNSMKIDIDEISSIKISASIGIAYAYDNKKFEKLYRSADIALYTAKKEGKGRYHIVNADTNKEDVYKEAVALNDQMSLNDLIDSSTIGAIMKTKTPYEALVENIPSGVMYIELTDVLKFTYCNDWMYKFSGYTKEETEELQADNPLIFVHPEDILMINEYVYKIVEGLNFVSLRYRFKHKNGQYKSISLSVSVTERKTDKIILYGVYSDVDEVIKIKDEINKYNIRLESIVNAIPGGVSSYSIGDEVKITNYNNWLLEYTGINVENFNYGYDPIWYQDVEKVKEAFRQVKEGSNNININYRVVHKDKTLRNIFFSGVVMERTKDDVLMYSIYFGKE